MNSEEDSGRSRADHFVTTRWTMVVSAGRKSSPDSERALAELCRVYWYPLYAYIRRRGRTREDAEDLTQAFFERFISGTGLEGVAAEKGRFRAYLLASMKHFLANEWDRSQRQKRGGGIEHLSLDWQDADQRFQLDPADPDTPEKLFDREWALALLGRAVERVRLECEADGKAGLFSRVKGFLVGGDSPGSYSEASMALGMEEGALRVAVHRLRKRYRELLRDEIAQTLLDPAMVDEELRALRASL